MNDREQRRRDGGDAAEAPGAGRPTDRLADEAGLEREGERAATTGRSWHSNPYLRKENMPGATGESLREWSRKHDAWQRGFEGSTPQPCGGVAKEELAADLLADLLQRRIREMASVRLELQRNRWSNVRVGPPRRCERDAEGRNWDVHSFECGALDESACPAEFRALVDELRDRYDLA